MRTKQNRKTKRNSKPKLPYGGGYKGLLLTILRGNENLAKQIIPGINFKTN